jgi:TrmH family RNA methyltransferase
MSQPITSTQNQRVKDLVRLRERRERDGSGLFLIEGYRELARALEAGVVLIDLYVCPQLYLGGNEPTLIDAITSAGVPLTELSEGAFRKVSYRDRPEGLLGVARQSPATLDRLPQTLTPLILVVESIEKPGNLGTMLRTADAAGVSAVVVCDPATDPYNPNVVRASLGTLFTVPLAIATTSDTIEWLAGRGIRSVATIPGARLAIWDADLTGALALVVGSEQYGLSPTWRRQADLEVGLPMAGSADSLNAAMAAGIALFEAVRQRR